MVLLPCPLCSGFKVVEWDRDGAFIDPEDSCRCELTTEQHRHIVTWGLLLLWRRYQRYAAVRMPEFVPTLAQAAR